jgi:hypothetical protein
LLRETDLNEEPFGFGSAVPNESHRKERGIIKDIGANFTHIAN